jgi:ABC-2 type transport system ATP-binding protein
LAAGPAADRGVVSRPAISIRTDSVLRRGLHANAMTAVVEATGLTKLYGSRTGVLDLEFAVETGEVFGYLGPNGAGKTTTIRLMLDLIRPTRGSIALFGRDVRGDSVDVRRQLGYLPGDVRLYERLTGSELIRYFSSLRGLTDTSEAVRLAERFQLDLALPIRTLSRGNKQKVAIVQAFMHRPSLLVLDEPTSGLDPLMQRQFYDLLRETTADGRTVFLSSHALPEVQQVADRVAVIRDGSLEVVDSVESLRARAPARVEATFVVPPPLGAFEDLPGVREIERRGTTVAFTLEGSVDPLVKALARFEVLALDSHEADLEDVFLGLYGKAGQGAS